MASTPSEDDPITGLCVVSDPAKCPPGYDLLYHSDDKKDDCDLWKDGFFKSRVTRYLCFTRIFPLSTSNVNEVLTDVVIQNEKESPPVGYTLLEQTVDTGEKATRKKQICIRMLPRSTTTEAIIKLMILSKSKRPPQPYTMAGEINGLMLCFKYGPVPKSEISSGKSIPVTVKSVTMPAISTSNSSSKIPSASSGFSPVGKQMNNNVYTHPLAGVPFQVNSVYLNASKMAKPFATDMSYRSYADIENEYCYSFNLERSTVNKSL